MIKAVVFDFFGVLYPDTLQLILRKYKVADKDKQQEIRDLRIRSDRGFIGRDEFWQGVAEFCGVSDAELQKELKELPPVDHELLAFITTLKPDYKIGMLSNVGKGFLERIFTADLPSEKYFDEIVTSSGIGYIKPEPEAYELTAQKLGVEPSECVMIDDRAGNCKGATRVGMQAIQYHDFEQMKRELKPLLTDTNH